MTKNEILEVLIPELERLEKEEHLRDLTRNGRYDEADAVIAEVNYSLFNEYGEACIWEEERGLEVSDIPEEYLVIYTLYLYGNKEYNEAVFMEHWEELQEAVAEQGEDGAIIARKMEWYFLNAFATIAELMSHEEDEEDAVD